MNRNNRKQIAEETLAILEKGNYTLGANDVNIKERLTDSIENTKLYIETDGFDDVKRQYETIIEIKNQTTNQALEEFVANKQSNVACLNFASAKNPGGGFKGGSQAQEECIARSSGLYACVSPIDEYYLYHRGIKSCFYSDRTIYSPKVPFFRDNDDKLLSQPYFADIITSAAVNMGVVKQREKDRLNEVKPAMEKRIKHVLNIAAKNDVKNIVLGAWGCGVFMNDPVMISQLFVEQLSKGGAFENVFERITFAVLDRNNKGIFSAFSDAFQVR